MITITTNARQVIADMSGVPAKLQAGAKHLLSVVIAPRLHQIVANEKITKGGILEPRSGNLGRSIFSRVEERDGLYGVLKDLVALVGFDLSIAKYGRLQEQGGTVRPTKGQFLAIPIGNALTDNGVPRFTAREFMESPGRLGYTGAFVAKGVIFGQLMKDVTPLFVLKRSVTIPARRPLASTLERETPWITDQFDQMAQQAIEPTGGA